MVPEYLILYRLDLEKRELYVMAHERLTEPGVTSFDHYSSIKNEEHTYLITLLISDKASNNLIRILWYYDIYMINWYFRFVKIDEEDVAARSQVRFTRAEEDDPSIRQEFMAAEHGG